MTEIITYAVAALIVGGAILFRKGKEGKSTAKSILNYFKQLFTPTKVVSKNSEELRTELLNKIDNMISTNQEQFSIYLSQLQAGATLISSSRKKTTANITKFKKEAIEYKELFSKTGNEEDKSRAMQYLGHLKNAESTLIKLKQSSKEIIERLETAEFEQEDSIASLEHKKIEIISEIDLVLNYKQTNFSIVELEREFEQKARIQKIEIKVDDRISKMEGDEILHDVDLEDAFNELK